MEFLSLSYSCNPHRSWNTGNTRNCILIVSGSGRLSASKPSPFGAANFTSYVATSLWTSFLERLNFRLAESPPPPFFLQRLAAREDVFIKKFKQRGCENFRGWKSVV